MVEYFTTIFFVEFAKKICKQVVLNIEIIKLEIKIILAFRETRIRTLFCRFFHKIFYLSNKNK